jgi:hypothetical protein
MNPNPRQIKRLKVVQATGSVTVEALADHMAQAQVRFELA